MEILFTLTAFVVLLLVGVPVAWTMGVTGLLGVFLLTGSTRIVLGQLETVAYGEGTSYSLITIPLFVLLAYVVQNARLSNDLFDAVAAWLGRLPGGLAISSIAAGGIFGAMSGTSVASATVMSRMAVPAMDARGYSRVLSTGSVAAGSTLSTLIPPSVVLIVYGISTETSVGQLLMAGVVPGILTAVALAIVILVVALRRPDLAPRSPSSTRHEKLRSVKAVLPVVGLIAVLMVCLYTGVASPTEIAAVGALLSIVLALVMRRLTWRGFVDAVRSTLKVTVMIFGLFIGAGFFGQFLTMARIPQTVVQWVDGLGLEPVGILLLVALIYIVGCMFVDEMPFMLLTLPVTFPLMTVTAGFDPVWYGVFSVMLLNIGLIAPPIGIGFYIACKIGGVPPDDAMKAIWPYIGALLIGLFLIAVFPIFSTALL